MEATIQTTVTVNGAAVTRAVPARQHLIDFLRETLGLTGSHVGCEHGVCGACTIRVDGEIVRGCLMLAVQAHGRKVDTRSRASPTRASSRTCRRRSTSTTPFNAASAPRACCWRRTTSSARAARHARRDPRVHGRQLLPLHRLPRDRRRGGRGARAPGSEEMNARAELPLHAPGTQVDKGYIGQSVPRPNAKRLLQGRGAFVDDLRFPRLAHVVFFRSPYAHARVKKLDLAKAARQPGVIAVLRRPRGRRILHALGRGARAPEGHQVGGRSTRSRSSARAGRAKRSPRSSPKRARRPRTRSPTSTPSGRSCRSSPTWRTRSPGAPSSTPDLGDNICFKREFDTGGVDDAFAKADVVVEETYEFGRHTGVTLEPRAILADYNAAEHSLTVYHSTQAPNMMQDIFSRHLDIPEANVRVICKDVGGSFGIKVHVYADEMATAALSVMLRRPVKFVADRLESFLTDIHAREHKAKVRLACTKAGEILAFDLDDLTAIGPYSVYPRTSGIEGNQVVNLTGGPYKHQQYRAKLHVVFTNKNVTCQYRAVGHPIAVALTEGIVDLAAAKLGMDPAEFRRRNLIADDAYPYTFRFGTSSSRSSRTTSASTSCSMLMDYKKLRAEQAALRAKGVHRGIGLAAMIEVTNPSPAFYGVGGARISAQDGATLRLEPTGMVTVPLQRHRAGPGDRRHLRADRGERGRRDDGQGAGHHRRHRDHAVRRRHLGIARRGHRRRSGAAGRAALRSNILDVAARVLEMDKAELDVAGTRSSTGCARVEARARRARAHRLLPPRHAADGFPVRTDGHAPLHAARLRLRLHQRHPGLARGGGHGHRLREAAQALVRRGLRHGHQSDAGRRADPRRHRAGHRRGALRALRLQRRGAAPERQPRRLPGADGGRDAGHRRARTSRRRPAPRSSARRARAKRAPPARRAR